MLRSDTAVALACWSMALEHESIISPYEVVLGRDGGRLMEVTIRAVGDAELTYDTIGNAVHAIARELRAGGRGESDVGRAPQQ